MDTCWNVFPLYTECEGRDDFEKEILIEMAEIDKFILPPVDLIVGLKCSRDQLAKHVAKRSADYEQRSESLRRVFTLLDWHTAFYSKTPEVFAVDTEGLDFSCDRDFLLVAERILAEAKLRTTSDGVAGQEHPELQNGPRARGPF
jgi:deoxyadenosine/deoxycytidine kinase